MPNPAIQKFDRDTGQIYTETELVVGKKKQAADWIGALKTPLIAKNFSSTAQAPQSLSHLATIKCAREIRNLTSKHFEVVPWSLAVKIWDEITSHYRESFHAWRTLASVFNGEDEFAMPEYRYSMHIRQPTLPAQEYFRGISSPDMKWVSALRVSPKQISTPELVSVASAENLVVLDLSDGQLLFDTKPSLFDERILRTWAELAAAGRAFTSLQVLMLGWQDNLSEWLFKYLDRFPSLCVVITTDCKHLHQKNRGEWEATATAHGWTAHHAKRSVKMLRPLLDDSCFHRAAVSHLYYHSHDIWEQLTAPNSGTEAPVLPLVECWLGTPRPWTHILDEFPGTRTIFFEKTDTKSTSNIDSISAMPIRTDSAKRIRDSAHTSHLISSPPRKRSQGKDAIRVKKPVMTAADLLQDMGLGLQGRR